MLTLGGRLDDDGKGDPLLDELGGAFEAAACPPAGAAFAGAPLLKRAARLALRAHVTPSIDTEVHKALRDVADVAAITVFAENVRKLLLAAPFGLEVGARRRSGAAHRVQAGGGRRDGEATSVRG